MADVSSSGYRGSEECDKDDVDEDEHLYQFTINFAPTASGSVAPVAVQQLEEYDSSDDDERSAAAKRSKMESPLRKPMSDLHVEESGALGRSDDDYSDQGTRLASESADTVKAAHDMPDVAASQGRGMSEVMKHATVSDDVVLTTRSFFLSHVDFHADNTVNLCGGLGQHSTHKARHSRECAGGG
jgi:hypothetical protein